MHWHIIGAGSIGCLWAYYLTQAGHSVTLILRTEEKLALFPGKITIDLYEGSATSVNCQAELADNSSKIENLLVTTKSYSAVDAVNTVSKRLSENATIVMMQNGMGAQQEIHQLYPDKQVFFATTTDGANQKRPFHVIQAGLGETLIGSPSAPAPGSWLASLKETRVSPDSNIEQKLWCKLAINCAINPLTAIHNCRNGQLPISHLKQMTEICSEVEQVASAIGITLFEQPLIERACQVAAATAENISSMLQDVRQDRPTEIEAITGFLCQQARQKGVATPANRELLQKVRDLSQTTHTKNSRSPE